MTIAMVSIQLFFAGDALGYTCDTIPVNTLNVTSNSIYDPFEIPSPAHEIANISGQPGPIQVRNSVACLVTECSSTPSSNQETSHLLLVNVDTLALCLSGNSYDLIGNIQNGNQQDDCLFDTDGNGTYDSRCFEWIFFRGPSSGIESIEFDFGKGNCSGEVDAGMAEINGMCISLGSGGSQNSTGPIYFSGTDTIKIFVCDNSAGQVTLCNFCTTLPVDLLQFEVVKSGNFSLVDWVTAMEINNDYFEIQRAGADKVFSMVGKVEGMGNTNSPTAYEFYDKAPLPGINYYRLKQFDWDGRYELSPARSLIFHEKWFRVKVRPTIPQTELYVEIETEDLFSRIQLIDITGRVVLTEQVKRDEFLTRLQVSHLGPGMYTVLVESGAQTYQERIVIMH